MTTNFDIGLPRIPSFKSQLFYSQNLDFVPSPDDTLPSVIRGINSLPAQSDGYERVRVMIFGSSYGINYTIRWLWGLNFAQISEWSVPIPAPGSSEMMSIVTKRIPLGGTKE
jgi:hypothetical protein